MPGCRRAPEVTVCSLTERDWPAPGDEPRKPDSKGRHDYGDQDEEDRNEEGNDREEDLEGQQAGEDQVGREGRRQDEPGRRRAQSSGRGQEADELQGNGGGDGGQGLLDVARRQDAGCDIVRRDLEGHHDQGQRGPVQEGRPRPVRPERLLDLGASIVARHPISPAIGSPW